MKLSVIHPLTNLIYFFILVIFALLFDGSIQIDSIPKELFSNNRFYTTFMNGMVQKYLPECITLKDLKKVW